jgi:hypothetical protein
MARSDSFQEAASTPFRGPDGHFRPASEIESSDDVFIGGWVMPAPRHPSPFPTYPDGTGSGDASFNVAPPPGFRVHNFGKLAIRSFVNLARLLWTIFPGRSPAPLSARRLLNAGRGSWIRTCSSHADLCCGMITSTRMACGMARH